MNGPAPHPTRRYFLLAGALTLGGLVLAVVYLQVPTPYTMVLFLGAGQGLLVAGIAAFAYAVTGEIRARLHSIVERRFAAGEVIFRQGDYPDRLYVVGKGEVEVVREQPGHPPVLLTRLGPEQFFGEIGILSDAPRSATVRAATDVEVLGIHRDYFASLISYLPAVRERIMAAYQARHSK